MTGPDLIPAFAFGPLGRPPDEELRFWRSIEDRALVSAVTQMVELACGHIVYTTHGKDSRWIVTQPHWPAALAAEARDETSGSLRELFAS